MHLASIDITLIVIYGAFVGAIVEAKVLGLNVNLYWGVVMMVSGLGALYLARRRSPSRRSDKSGG